jgi:hypothetical protein
MLQAHNAAVVSDQQGIPVLVEVVTVLLDWMMLSS